jgi:hypothetical protein
MRAIEIFAHPLEAARTIRFERAGSTPGHGLNVLCPGDAAAAWYRSELSHRPFFVHYCFNGERRTLRTMGPLLALLVLTARPAKALGALLGE